MKILVDEMLDGWDLKLQHMGYDAHSVKKIKDEHGLNDDNSMIGYARENGMVLITKYTRCGRDCWPVDVPCILLDDAVLLQTRLVQRTCKHYTSSQSTTVPNGHILVDA